MRPGRLLKKGKVTKTDPDGTITQTGICSNGKILVVVSIKGGNKIIIKTAYYGN